MEPVTAADVVAPVASDTLPVAPEPAKATGPTLEGQFSVVVTITAAPRTPLGLAEAAVAAARIISPAILTPA